MGQWSVSSISEQIVKTRRRLAIVVLRGRGRYCVWRRACVSNYARDARANAAPAAAAGVPVTVSRLKPRTVRPFAEFSGRIHAVDYAEIRPQVSGRIMEIRFHDGQTVKGRRHLFVIDPRPYQAAVDKAEADLATAVNNAKFAKTESDRGNQLVKTNALSQETYDQRANTDAVAQAAVQIRHAVLAAAQINVDYAFVKAPISGRISRAEITLVIWWVRRPRRRRCSRPSRPTMVFMPISKSTSRPISTACAITVRRRNGSKKSPWTSSSRVTTGVSITAPSKVSTIGSSQSGTIRARARFANSDGGLIAGMFVSVRMGNGALEDALLVPESAIGNDQSKRFVFVVGDNDKAEYRTVQLGPQVDGKRVVTTGVNAGDRVILDHLQRLAPGAAVQPQTESPNGEQLIPTKPIKRNIRELDVSVEILHRPADFCRRDLDRHFSGGADCDDAIADLGIPGSRAAFRVVTALFPGANPDTVANTVATPLEEQINGAENMLYMFSQSASDGTLTLTVTFKLGTDPNLAQQLVQNRVNQALPRLPDVTRNLGVTTVKSSPDLTMVVHLMSIGDRYDMLYLRNYAVLNVKDQLAKIEGVGSVQLFGSGDYAMRLWLNPQRIAELGLSADDVVNAVRRQNVQVAAGLINGPPYSEKGELQLPIIVEGRLSNPEQFDEIVIKNQNGVVTRLRDVARVEIDASEYSLRSLLDNQQAVAIPIFQAPGSNAIEISNRVRATMEELKKNFPEGMDYSIVYDPTVFVRDSIKAVVHTLLEAVLLVVLVVILFLQTWRASIIPLLAVPTSIVGTFAAMYLFGFSINALSLFGLVLAIGIVVDDAIVVVENVERNIEAGLPSRRDVEGHERSHRSDHRHCARALRRVRADRVHQRIDRRVLPAICADHRLFDHHLRVQFIDFVAGAVRAPA